MSNVKIIMSRRVDQPGITAALAESGSYILAVENRYSDTSAAIALPLDIGSLPVPNQNAWRTVMDDCTYLFEQGEVLWKITRDGHSFDTGESYLRNVSTTKDDFAELADGTPLLMLIEVPRFEENHVAEVSLWYNQAFDPEEVAALAEIGIYLTGNGKAFDIANDIEFRIYFRQPESVPGSYVIFYDGLNQIVTP